MFRLTSKASMQIPTIDDQRSAESSPPIDAKHDDAVLVEVPSLQDEVLPKRTLPPAIERLLDGNNKPPTYDNIQDNDTEAAEIAAAAAADDMSLQTTSSQDSIDLSDLLTKVGGIINSASFEKNKSDDDEDEDDLSFHASGVGSLEWNDIDLTTTCQLDTHMTTKPEEALHGMDVLLNVSQHLLKEEEVNVNKVGSKLAHFKFWYIALAATAFLGVKMAGHTTDTRHVPGVRMEQVVDSYQPVLGVLQDDMVECWSFVHTNNVPHNFTQVREEVISESCSWAHIAWQLALLTLVAQLGFTKVLSNKGQSNISKADSTHTIIKDEYRLGLLLADYDLAKYEDLKAVELRALLRSRKINYEGNKRKLARRMASVYQTELQTLTVVQLRRKLKFRGMKQGGRKHELVQNLVEVGL